MAKKFSLLLASVAVVAFAVPAVANAGPQLTMPPGTLIAPGTFVVGTSTDVTMQTSFGLLSCKKITVTVKVTRNDGVAIHAEGAGVSTTTECFLGGTKKIEITNLNVSTFSSTVTGSGQVNFTFEADLPNSIVCHFETPAAGITFTYPSSPASDVITSAKQKLVAKPPVCQPAEFKGTFTLETDPETGTGGVIIE